MTGRVALGAAVVGPLLLLPGPKSGSARTGEAGIVKAPAVRAKASIFLRMGTPLTR